MKKRPSLYKSTYIIFILILLFFAVYTFIPLKTLEIKDVETGEMLLSENIFLYTILDFYIIPFVACYFLNVNLIIFSLSKYSLIFDKPKIFIVNIFVFLISIGLFILSLSIAFNSNLMNFSL